MAAESDESISKAAARDLLEEMVSIPSPTGEESEAADHLADFLRAHGREAWIDEVGNVRAPGDDAVLLTSHVDTVPGEVPVRVEGSGDDAVLYGRGSVDATGPLCAMAVAAVETGAAFVGVVGEETDSRGARHLVDDREAPGAVVNGEPSGWDALTLGYRGFLAGTATAETEASHTGRPDPNAVQRLLAWWDDVQREVDEATVVGEAAAPGDGSAAAPADEAAVFESVTATPVSVEGGASADGHAVTADLDAQFRLPPGTAAADVEDAVTALADDYGVTVDFEDPIPPTLQSARTEPARALRAAIREVGGVPANDESGGSPGDRSGGVPASDESGGSPEDRSGGDPRHLRKTGTSDMNVYTQSWDCPAVTYGPGDSTLDHAPNEHLPLAAYDRAIDVLSTAAREVIEG